MFSTFQEKVRLAWADETLRMRLLYTILFLVLTRLLAFIPVPGVDASKVSSLLAGNQFLSLFNIFSGGGLSSFSIALLGVSPYITASIVMQVMTIIFPTIKQMYQEEGEAGRRKFAQYSRLLSVPLGLIQGYAFLIILEKQNILPVLSFSQTIIDLIIISAGSMLMVWIGELITEFGIGNGISLIIFAGIISRLPSNLGQLLFTYDASQLPVYIAAFVAIVLVIFGIVFVTEAERPIPITYSRGISGESAYGGVSTYLPLRLNQAGVVPIIFAISLILFPQLLFQFLVTAKNVSVASFSQHALNLINNQWFYAAIYFILVVLFTYFYTAIVFDPVETAKNLQKTGAFIPGVRPGQSTSDFISRILTRITLVGALFLGLVAVLPLALRGATGNQTLAIGGTALLIVVSVAIDLVKKIDAQISAKEY